MFLIEILLKTKEWSVKPTGIILQALKTTEMVFKAVKTVKSGQGDHIFSHHVCILLHTSLGLRKHIFTL